MGAQPHFDDQRADGGQFAMKGSTINEYVSNATYEQLAERIAPAKHIALVSHFKADGDSIGSMLALVRALRARRQRAEALLTGPVDSNLLVLAGDTPCLRVESLPGGRPGDDYDLIIVVDTGAWSQLETVADWLRSHHDRVIGIDHHAHGDDVAALRVVDPSMASTTQMVVKLLDVMGEPITGGVNGVAEALFLGLATDTGWFRHGNAGAEVFQVAARLLACGVDKSRLHQLIEESHRAARLGLAARALSSITYAGGGRIAIMSLGPRDFEETGGTVEDLTGMVNLPLVVATIEVSILMAQTEPKRTKVSFRSKSSINPLDPDEFVDVNELAQRFGGGGHVHAAGAKFDMDLPEARARLLTALGNDSAIGREANAEG